MRLTLSLCVDSRMFPLLFATLLSALRTFSLVAGVFFITTAPALADVQEGGFVKFDSPHPLPPMVLHDVSGQETTLSSVMKAMPQQAFILLHLWSPSCRICVNEIRAIDKVRASLAQQNMIVVSLAQDPNGLNTVPAFARRQDIGTDGLFIDKSLTAMRTLRPVGVPTTYIVSQAGSILAMHEGAIEW